MLNSSPVKYRGNLKVSKLTVKSSGKTIELSPGAIILTSNKNYVIIKSFNERFSSTYTNKIEHLNSLNFDKDLILNHVVWVSKVKNHSFLAVKKDIPPDSKEYHRYKNQLIKVNLKSDLSQYKFKVLPQPKCLNISTELELTQECIIEIQKKF